MDILNSPYMKPVADYLSSILTMYNLQLLLAVYVALRAVNVFTGTPALASTHEHKSVTSSRQLFFVLHGFVLCMRWGFGLTYTVAVALKNIRVDNDAGSYITGYVNQLPYYSLLTTPIEASLDNYESFKMFFFGLSVVAIIADHFLAAAFWSALFKSSTVPLDKNNKLLFSTRPFADIISRSIAGLIDFAIVCGGYVLLIQFTEVADSIPVPRECHLDFTRFVIIASMLSAAMKVATIGQGIGRKIVGVGHVTAHGVEVSFVDVIVRELMLLLCSTGYLNPLIITLNEEQGSMVDLMTNERDVDLIANKPYAASVVATTPAAMPKAKSSPVVKNTPKTKTSSKSDGSTSKPPATPKSANKTKTPAKAKVAKGKTPVKGVVTLTDDALAETPTTPTPTDFKWKAKAKSSTKVNKKTPQSSPPSKSASKRPRDDDGDDDEEEVKPPKSTRKSVKTPKRVLVEEAPPTTTRKSSRKR